LILDTNALSALAEGDRSLAPLLRETTQIALPVIALGEYRYGISRSRDRLHYERWLTEYLPTLRILDIDEGTTAHYATVRGQLKKAGTPIPTNDAWIAALARQYALPVISRDRHFDLVPGTARITW
jgi:tRNA(fMet)-specific endonuclease VapC